MLWLLASSSLAHAQKRSEPFVVLEAPRARSPWLEQAIIRVRAELGAVGLSILEVVSDKPLEPGESPRWFDAAPALQARGRFYGALVLVEKTPGRAQISAYSSERGEPVSQNVDQGSASAEVLAVRAVESLRAVMTQALRTRERSVGARAAAEVPQAVARFTERERLTPETRASETRTSESARVDEEPEPRSDGDERVTAVDEGREGASGLILQAGPLLHFGSPEAGVGAGLEVRASWVHRWLLIGLWFDGAAGPGQIDAAGGEIQTRHVAGGLRVGGLWRWSSAWSSQLGLGAGLVGYEIASGDARLSPHSSETRSSSLRIDASVDYWWLRNAALSAGSALSLNENAPVLRVDGEEIARLGRPSWSVTMGVLIRFD